MKTAFHNGIEYHFPEKYADVGDYLASIQPTQLSKSVATTLKWNNIKIVRNSKIAATDWTQMPDVPLTAEQKAAFAAYRQTLRDIPQTYSDPDLVEWPAVPAV